MKIKTLNQDTISKIAAGEVILRPASVVKELVENGIDASATKIDVEVKSGGKESILVRDDGIGIAYDEVALAFKDHATSKISQLSDLDEIETMGFRGEALSSIIACADLLITTREQEEELGSQTIFKDGYIENQKVYPYERGTEIIVTDLFGKIPARHKFLKKDETEERDIRDIMEKLAISHPNIAFSYTSNGKTVFKTSGNGNLKDVARSVLGQNFSKHLHAFETENLPMKIYGLMGDLDARRTYRANQIFFINGRFVKDKTLIRAFEEVWDGKLMKHQYPSGIIFVDLPANMLDFNVHPQKKEIRILNQTLVTLLFKQCIKTAIDSLNIIPEEFSEIPEEETPKESPVQETYKPELEESLMIKREPTHKKEPVKTEQRAFYEKPETISFTDYQDLEEEKKTKLDFSQLKLIGQVFKTYIILEDQEMLYLIDQHAAHEAILYEIFSEKLKSGEGFESQLLLSPVTVAASLDEIENFKTVKEQLKTFGFEAEVVDDSLLVTAVPMIADVLQLPELIIPTINWFSGLSERAPEFGLKKIISISCKAAIKGGEELTDIEIETLLKRLSKLNNPYTCPHGRPVIRKRSIYELEKLFKRVV